MGHQQKLYADMYWKMDELVVSHNIGRVMVLVEYWTKDEWTGLLHGSEQKDGLD